MANPNWARWVTSSIAVFFADVIDDGTQIPFIVEGVDERSTSFMEAPAKAEIRINGPFTKQYSGNITRMYVDINVLVTVHMGGEATNSYTLEEHLGMFHEAMDGNIPIFRFGSGVEDDDTLLECLSPRPQKDDSIRVLHFGQLEQSVHLRQGMVDARYVAWITS